MPEKPDKAEGSDKSMAEVIAADGRYPPEAYGFLHEGLAKAVKGAHGAPVGESGRHHVTGEQLCCSLRDLAAERWGLLARTVLAKWNIGPTIAIGNIVYLLIRHNFIHKTQYKPLAKSVHRRLWNK